VRVLLPSGFSTPFEAVVSRKANFVCRADRSAGVTERRQGELWIFTYGDRQHGERPAFRLRSEAATVVIDSAGSNRRT